MDEDQPAQPVVERVERPDGRYILFFSWPDEPVTDERTSAAAEAEPDE